MHVPVFPVVLTVQEFPPGPEGVGLGLTVLGEVDGAGRLLGLLGPLGPPAFSMSQGKQSGLPIGMDADWCSNITQISQSPEQG